MKTETWKEQLAKAQAQVESCGMALRKTPEEIEEMVHRERQRLYMRRRQQVQTDSIGVFLEDEDGFCYDPYASVSSQELYEIYCTWCIKENTAPAGLRALTWRLKHSAMCYPVREATLTRNGCRCRGFRGIRAGTDDTDNEYKTD